MKRLALLIPVILLSGCLATTRPVTKLDFPAIPDDLKQACPDLVLADRDSQKLSDLISTVGDNYTQYNLCKIKVDAWIEWYNTQKQISDSVK